MSDVESPDDVSPVPPAEIRARKHPLAVGAVWLYELAAAYVVATPVHAWARSVWAGHPSGDEPLFRPGGYALLTWLDVDGPELGIVVRTTTMLLLLFAIASTLVTSGLVSALATRGAKSFGRALRVGAASFFPVLAAGVVFGAIEGFFIGVGLFASSALDHQLQAGYGDERAFLGRVVVLAVFVVLALATGVVGDLARVTIARNVAHGTGEKPLREGIVIAVRTARRKIGRAFLAWGWRSATATALIALGAMLSDRTHGHGGGALWLLFFAHQAIIVARAALRTSWLPKTDYWRSFSTQPSPPSASDFSTLVRIAFADGRSWVTMVCVLAVNE